jgi:hypothetical protein
MIVCVEEIRKQNTNACEPFCLPPRHTMTKTPREGSSLPHPGRYHALNKIDPLKLLNNEEIVGGGGQTTTMRAGTTDQNVKIRN